MNMKHCSLLYDLLSKDLTFQGPRLHSFLQIKVTLALRDVISCPTFDESFRNDFVFDRLITSLKGSKAKII